MKKIQHQKIKPAEIVHASPVLKWAGGKTQLLPILNQHYPSELVEGKVNTIIEPFLGGGAVFFDIVNKYDFKRAFLFDINPELILLYNVIKYDVEQLIAELGILQNKYLSLDSEKSRKELYYKIRSHYNEENALEYKAFQHSPFNFRRAAKTIFLNRTCFNGLHRVNNKGQFNVPHGQYKNPRILFKEKLLAASIALQKATIRLCDFSECANHITSNTFIYYDPPYRPLSKTSGFTAYSQEGFGDNEQIRLAEFIKRINSNGIFQMLSNSDPTNYRQDNFFDNLYADFKIFRISAKRIINSNARKRGELREILVRNY